VTQDKALTRGDREHVVAELGGLRRYAGETKSRWAAWSAETIERLLSSLQSTGAEVERRGERIKKLEHDITTATEHSYAEGVKAGCEEVSVQAAQMLVELEQAQQRIEQLESAFNTEAHFHQKDVAKYRQQARATEAEVERLRLKESAAQSGLRLLQEDTRGREQRITKLETLLAEYEKHGPPPERVQLREAAMRITELEEGLRRIATETPITGDGHCEDEMCFFCGGANTFGEPEHRSDCDWLTLRSLLPETPQTKREDG
jgi:chromosome segregation ATPase